MKRLHNHRLNPFLSPKARLSNAGAAFNLIELLVVIAIVGILASLLLPVISRVKSQAKMTVCLNNLHQLGVAVNLFVEDQKRYPGGLGGHEIAREFTCGATDQQRAQEMQNRPLYHYIKPSEVYRCPEDRGKDFSPNGINYAPSLYYAVGCSYVLNAAPWKYTKHRAQGVLPGQADGWVKQPTRYVMVYEPPARPSWKIVGTGPCHLNSVEVQYHFHWHFNTGFSTVNESQFAADAQKFISPILFVDGHAAKHDFTRVLRDDPNYPTEETADWIWYQYPDAR